MSDFLNKSSRHGFSAAVSKLHAINATQPGFYSACLEHHKRPARIWKWTINMKRGEYKGRLLKNLSLSRNTRNMIRGIQFSLKAQDKKINCTLCFHSVMLRRTRSNRLMLLYPSYARKLVKTLVMA